MSVFRLYYRCTVSGLCRILHYCRILYISSIVHSILFSPLSIFCSKRQNIDSWLKGADHDLPDVDYDTSDDLMIAQMLQKQFDKEYDLALAKEEQSLNR